MVFLNILKLKTYISCLIYFNWIFFELHSSVIIIFYTGFRSQIALLIPTKAQAELQFISNLFRNLDNNPTELCVWLASHVNFLSQKHIKTSKPTVLNIILLNAQRRRQPGCTSWRKSFMGRRFIEAGTFMRIFKLQFDLHLLTP